MKLEGGREIHFRLLQIERKAAGAATRKALRAGAKIIQSEAKARAPVEVGRTRKAIRVRAGKSRKGVISVMVAIGAKWFGGPTFYAAFVALGHKLGKRLRRGGTGNRKEVPANPYLQEAFDAAKPRAIAKIVEVLRTELGLK